MSRKLLAIAQDPGELAVGNLLLLYLILRQQQISRTLVQFLAVQQQSA